MPVGSFAQELKRTVDRLVDAEAGGAIAQQGSALQTSEDGTLTAAVNGKVVRARLATEEPILPGEKIWVARTKDGTTIVHGGDH